MAGISTIERHTFRTTVAHFFCVLARILVAWSGSWRWRRCGVKADAVSGAARACNGARAAAQHPTRIVYLFFQVPFSAMFAPLRSRMELWRLNVSLSRRDECGYNCKIEWGVGISNLQLTCCPCALVIRHLPNKMIRMVCIFDWLATCSKTCNAVIAALKLWLEFKCRNVITFKTKIAYCGWRSCEESRVWEHTSRQFECNRFTWSEMYVFAAAKTLIKDNCKLQIQNQQHDITDTHCFIRI